jgi:hypothetical protein
MALPGRPHTFALENCRDLYNKLDREIDRFTAARNDIDALKDLAFNIAVTAWHLCDWVFADMTTAQRDKLNIQTIQDMWAHARECRALYLCRLAATASKHWEITNYPDPRVKIVVTANAIGGEPVKMPPLQIAADWHLYFVDGDEVEPAENVFSDALCFWTQYIYGNGIAKEEPDGLTK